MYAFLQTSGVHSQIAEAWFSRSLENLTKRSEGEKTQKGSMVKDSAKGYDHLAMEKVCLLLRDIQEKLTSVPETKGGKVMKYTGTLVLLEDTILVDEDLIMEAVKQGGATVTKSDSTGGETNGQSTTKRDTSNNRGKLNGLLKMSQTSLSWVAI